MSKAHKEMIAELYADCSEEDSANSGASFFDEGVLSAYRENGVRKRFQKHDQGKSRYSLIPPLAEEEMVKVLTFGANKYAPNNWQNVDDMSRYVDATLRHIASYRKGERNDAETNLHHLAHAMCCLAFIVDLEKQNES